MIKDDFTTKLWNGYQKVVDYFKGRVTFVQIGKGEDNHTKLSGVVDMIGQTSLRKLILWTTKAEAGIGPITLLQHLCAAFNKPYFCLAGGRENVTWIQYPCQHTFHTIGQLDCCIRGGCWRSRVVPLGDEHVFDQHTCKYPIQTNNTAIAQCMELIKPVEVISAIERYLAAQSFMQPALN